jgi:hypothetical protein
MSVSEDSTLYPVSNVVKCGYKGCFEMKNLKVCTRCRNQWYCGQEHQKADWKSHKQVCKLSTTDEAAAQASRHSSAKFGQASSTSSSVSAESCCYTLADMPFEEIVPIYNEGVNLRHGYNLMDKAAVGLFEALCKESYPSQTVEGLFGMQMEPANELYQGVLVPTIGNLVQLVWLALFKDKYKGKVTPALRTQVVMMILLGKYPEWWELEVMEFASSPEGHRNIFVQQLLHRGMQHIKYDKMLYMFKYADNLSEQDLAFLSETTS